MRKQNYPEVMLARLQADRGEIGNLLPGQNLLELSKAATGKCGQGLGHFGDVVKGDKAAAAVRQLGNIFSCATGLHVAQEVLRESLLHRRQQRTPASRKTNNGLMRR